MCVKCVFDASDVVFHHNEGFKISKQDLVKVNDEFLKWKQVFGIVNNGFLRSKRVFEKSN